MIHRPTRDAGLFLLDAASSDVSAAAASFEAALGRQGWSRHRVIDQHDFIRMEISEDREHLIIDLGRDSPPEEPVDTTSLGPTLSLRDLAARKTLALFGRAEARDFADVYDLAHRYRRDHLLALAAADDSGFDRRIFASMIATIDRTR
jgi:Nucleotidyl transferase AbiEii toxin, Type IV TA system